MPFISAFGESQIYYEIYGNGNPVVVFVSGFMGIADIWRPLATKPSTKYFCIAHDNRGFGCSSKPKDRIAYSVENHAHDITLLLNVLDVDQPVILVTHSMGGNIASAFALASPERVAGIVYTGTYYDGKQMREKGVTYKALTENGHNPTDIIKFYTNFGLTEDIALEAAKWSPCAREHNAWSLVDFEMGDRYAEITIPTMIVQGNKDVVNPPDFVRQMAEELPNCRLEFLDGVNHFPPTEAPEKLDGLICEFVGALPL